MNYEKPSMTIVYLEDTVECILSSLDGSFSGTVDTEGNTDINEW